MAASEFKWEIHSGTPLSTDNPLWVYWDDYSSQHEWAVPCANHSSHSDGGSTGAHWNILGPENLTPYGIVCGRCEKPINTLEGTWVRITNPPNATYKGFRMPQIGTHFADFPEICNKFVNRPVVTLRESFAYSVEEAVEAFPSHLLEHELCSPELQGEEDRLAMFGSTRPVYAGIDWHQGGDTTATVLVFGTYIKDDVFTWLAGYRFKGDPESDLREMVRLIELANAQRIVADFGAGYMRNRMLMEHFGYPRFITCHYVRQERRILLHPNSLRLRVDRNNCLDDLVTAMKMRPGRFELPCRKYMERVHWWQDLRAVLVESDHVGRTQFIKRPGHSDDFFHGMFYTFLASHMVKPRPDVLAPILISNNDEESGIIDSSRPR